MEKQEIQKLRELPIEGVAERLGLRVTRHKCLCPFHEDHHASLSFHVSRNTYRCFVCGATGDTISLAMRQLSLNFIDACRWLANDSNIILTEYKAPPVSDVTNFDPKRYERFFERPWLSDVARAFLFAERMIDERVVRWCRLTSWRDRNGVNWLQTPYYDRDCRLIGVQNRNLGKCPSEGSGGLPASKDLGGLPRFRFPYGSRCSIYNLPVLNLLRPGEPLWITEGCSDCWAMLSAGRKAIAIPSATLLKPQDVEILSALSSTLSTEYHMYPDRDEPGERLFLLLQQKLPSLVHHQLPAGCKDFSEYYVKANPFLP